MRTTLALAACLLFATACDEPDSWSATTDTSIGANPSGGGTIVIRSNSAQLVGIVNAPVAPEVIYIGFGGPAPGVSVMDLNGFGQGTGDLNSTRFPLNPNIGLPGVVPALWPGTSNLDAGGAGVLTLTQDSLGNNRLLGTAVGEIADMAIGQPLDLVFNNANINPNAGPTNQVNPTTGLNMAGNSIMVAPHPNPPRLVLPAPNPAMGIECEEPTVASSMGPPYPFLPAAPPNLITPVNVLVPGNPFSSQPGTLGIFGASFPGVFYGPQPMPPSPPPPPPYAPFVSRQQIGHFLYLLDLTNQQIAVVNSNRFTALAAIPVNDPTDLAMSPNLTRLAVSSASTGLVSFVDTDPLSPTFHQVVAQTQLQPGLGELAWQPEGEDLLVLNERQGTLSLIDGVSLQLRKVLSRELRAPRALAVSARQLSTGFLAGVWFAYVLNGDGSVAVFESGPDGPNGIGYDDVLGALPLHFRQARALAIDSDAPGFWVAHQDAQGLGQLSRVQLTSSPAGPMPLQAPGTGDPSSLPFRQKEWTVVARYGGGNPTTPVPTLFSGNRIVDLAFDDIHNLGGFPDQTSPYGPGIRYAQHSGKGLLKNTPGGAQATRRPMLAFVALADSGGVDVIELTTGSRLATVPAPGVASLCDYWRQ